MKARVLDGADVVVAVSPLVRDEFRGMTSSRVELVTNGFDEDDFSQERPPQGKEFRLVHTGLFAADGNPEVLWKVLGEKCRQDGGFASALKIVLAGKTDSQILQSIGEASLPVENLGYCSHDDTVRLQQGASILLLPLRKEPEYRATLPGKLFEYLGARRPVLGIGQSDGAMAGVLKETLAGQTFEWEDERGLRKYIDDSWAAYQGGGLADTAGDISPYTRRETARRMAEILDSL